MSCIVHAPDLFQERFICLAAAAWPGARQKLRRRIMRDIMKRTLGNLGDKAMHPDRIATQMRKDKFKNERSLIQIAKFRKLQLQIQCIRKRSSSDGSNTLIRNPKGNDS